MNDSSDRKEEPARLQDEEHPAVCGESLEKPTPEQITEHICQLLLQSNPPELPPQLAAVKPMPEIHSYIIAIRNQLQNYMHGNFSERLKMPGVVAGMLKALQANMLHCIWQMEQIKTGDLSQRVDFMGGFADVFNSMAQQLGNALIELREKEAQLTVIAHELQQEVEKRGATLAVLQKSAENFQYLAEHDPLTGLLNRRSFFARAEVELARTVIMNNSCVLVVTDVDKFKQVNDTYGHLTGDAVLKQIAHTYKATLRDGDVVGRLGGEEFIALLTDSSLEQGYATAERLRQTISSSRISSDDQTITVTVSSGLTTILPAQGAGGYTDLLTQALSLADQAMYRAKELGRNRVEIASFTTQDNDSAVSESSTNTSIAL